MRSSITSVAAALSLGLLSCAPPSLAADDAALTARDAGRRYGEAAGAAMLCYGLKINPEQVTQLRARYSGDDLAEFDVEAGKVLKAWQSALRCENADGPNECKVSQQWSCQQAMKDIGPGGTAAPGLVEPKR